MEWTQLGPTWSHDNHGRGGGGKISMRAMDVQNINPIRNAKKMTGKTCKI